MSKFRIEQISVSIEVFAEKLDSLEISKLFLLRTNYKGGGGGLTNTNYQKLK